MKNDIGNAMGNRIAKHVFDDNWNLEKSTYYILDAQGNQLSMYEHEVQSGGAVDYTLAERNIYGSSQMGTLNAKVHMYSPVPSTENTDHVLGEKYYSLSNHLGNVLTVISDQKLPLDQNNDQEVDEYLASIVNVADYSPFGVELDGRTISNGDYRYGFQGQESDDEVKGDGNSVNYKYRMHDPRVGRFFAIDPLSPKYPGNSSYAFSQNRVIDATELKGLEEKRIHSFQLPGTMMFLEVSFRRYSKFTPSLPVGIKFRKLEVGDHPDPLKKCYEFFGKTREIITETSIIITPDTKIPIDDIGSAIMGVSEKTTIRSYPESSGYEINWDPHAQADKIMVTNSTTGDILKIVEGVQGEVINIPCGVPITVQIDQKGTYTCDINTVQNLKTTTIKTYVDGVLKRKTEDRVPTDECPDENTRRDENTETYYEKRKVPCPKEGEEATDDE